MNCTGKADCANPVYNRLRQLCKNCYTREWKAGRISARAPAKGRAPRKRAECPATQRRAARVAARKGRTGFSAALVAACWTCQQGTCAICSVGMLQPRQVGFRVAGLRAMHCDHAHAAAVPRGLLCFACNAALGYYEASQRPAGLRVPQYETYLAQPPAQRVIQIAAALGFDLGLAKGSKADYSGEQI